MFQHLKDKQISYCVHLRQAFWVGFKLFTAVPKVLIHGIWPDLYPEDASQTCEEILRVTRVKLRKRRRISEGR